MADESLLFFDNIYDLGSNYISSSRWFLFSRLGLKLGSNYKSALQIQSVKICRSDEGLKTGLGFGTGLETNFF